MSVIKVVELMSSSPKSWEDAAHKVLAEASQTLHNIRSIYIKEQSAVVTDNKIVEYRMTVKLSFEVDHIKG